MGAPEESSDFRGQLWRLREAPGHEPRRVGGAALTAKISALERGERLRPYPQTVRALADALNLSDADRSALIASVPNRVRPQLSTKRSAPPKFSRAAPRSRPSALPAT
jgi:hypothetical protein